jgi:nicotinate-nucleotide adenylyltransferase
MKRILLFGGTFDPIHLGHLGLLGIVKEKLLIDEVILLPTKQPPWKSEMAPIEHRLAMLQLALAGTGYQVSSYEIEEPGVNYTIDTINYFHGKYPHDTLYYLIGADQAALFHEWKQSEAIAAKAQLVVYGRPGYDFTRQNVEKYHMSVVEGRKFDISSTAIRQSHSLDMPWPVIEYILDHDLYFAPKLKSYYDPERFLHVVSVAKLAYQIAESNRLDVGKATCAALLHDIGKNVNKELGRQMIKEDDPKLSELPEFSVHQFVGAILAKRDFGINDEEILEAIRYHASAKPDMTPLGMIIYAADKIEPRRGFDSRNLISSCLHDYRQGFIDVLKDNYAYHDQKGLAFKHYLTAEAIKFYLEDKHEN